MDIIKQNLKWNGKLQPFTQRINKLVLHHMAHPSWTFMDVHKFHRDGRGWFGIGYNYWIGFDGRIYEGRGMNVGAHAAPYNSTTLGIGFQGDFRQKTMTDAQVRSGAWLCRKFIDELDLKIDDVVGHGDVNATSCPGPYFRWNEIRNAIRNPAVEKDGLYRVQIGAFENKSGADRLEREVKSKGFDTYVPYDGQYHRVQVGAYENISGARDMLKRVRDAGYPKAFIPGVASEPSTTNKKYKVTVNAINVRRIPSTDGNTPVGTMSRGTEFTVTEEQGTWGKHSRGWSTISPTYVEEVGSTKKIDYSDFPTLRKGDRGEHVKIMQKGLIDRGYEISAGATGNYFDQTERAALAFLKDVGLVSRATSNMDNVYWGPRSWGALLD